MLSARFDISGTPVGFMAQPYLIAEAGSNFNQSLDTARELISAAAEAGADAVKFQLFRAAALYPDGGEMYDIFKSIELDPAWLSDLAAQAEASSITLLASAFDAESITVLDQAGLPALKVASSETTNLPLLLQMARIGRPLIISTGMCDMVDVEIAVDACTSINNREIALMQCGSVYPLPAEDANLRVISTFAQRFGCPVGLSDHTLGATAAIAAAGLGARLFEKHFTLDRKSPGPDHFYALEPAELGGYAAAIHEAHAMLGATEKVMLPEEKRVGRRDGLHAARPLRAGQVLSAEDLRVGRPALGIRARYVDAISGLTLANDVVADQPLQWSDLAGEA